MITLAATAFIAAAPALFRQGLLALLRERWPQLLLSLTADATQVPDRVGHHAFALLVLDGALPGLHVPELLARLHQARPTQRLVVLADPHTLSQRTAPLAWPGTRLLVPSQVAPQALATALAPWLAARSPAAIRAPYPPARPPLRRPRAAGAAPDGGRPLQRGNRQPLVYQRTHGGKPPPQPAAQGWHPHAGGPGRPRRTRGLGGLTRFRADTDTAARGPALFCG